MQQIVSSMTLELKLIIKLNMFKKYTMFTCLPYMFKMCYPCDIFMISFSSHKLDTFDHDFFNLLLEIPWTWKKNPNHKWCSIEWLKGSLLNTGCHKCNMSCVKRIWYLLPMRAVKVQASLRICAVSPEPPLLAHTSSESRGTFTQKARSLAPLNDWACAVKICHDGMLEDTNSLDGAQHNFAK